MHSSYLHLVLHLEFIELNNHLNQDKKGIITRRGIDLTLFVTRIFH